MTDEKEQIENIITFKALHEFKLRKEQQIKLMEKGAIPKEGIEQLKKIVKITKEKINKI